MLNCYFSSYQKHFFLHLNLLNFFSAVGPKVAPGGIFPPPDAALELLANLPPPQSFQVNFE